MRLLILISLFAYAQLSFAQNEVLTNNGIVEMKTMGFSDGIIITKIKTSSQVLFCTEIDSLNSLKAKGISDEILVAMMEKGIVAESAPKSEKSIVDSLGIGLFMMDVPKVFTKINPSVFSGTKTHTLAAAFTYGLADSEIASTIDKPYSSTCTQNFNPSFFFFFSEESKAKANTANWPFIYGSSPNEFVLVKLYATNKKRKLRTGKVNIYAGMSMGVNEDDIVSFTAIPINRYAFKIVLDQPLSSGEYGFIYQGAATNGIAFGQTIYDFSVRAESVVVPKFRVGSWVHVLRNGKPYYYIVKEIKVENGEIYYIGATNLADPLKYAESECYNSKKELLKANKQVDD